MTADELVKLLDDAYSELTIWSTTFEAEQIRKRIDQARVQLARPQPALECLRDLCAASREGKHMDRYTDSDVIVLWTEADRALNAPYVPRAVGEDVELVFEEEAVDTHGWVQMAGSRCAPAPGDRVMVWRRRA